MSRNLKELLNTVPSRDFFISKEVYDKYLSPLVDDIWQSYHINKGEIVHYSVLVAYTAWERGNINFDPENVFITTNERAREVDLGRISEFLNDEELTVYVSILIMMYDVIKVGEDFQNCFKAIRQLAEKGLELLYLAVSSELIVDESIKYIEDMEILFSKLSELKVV
jgi:hypothetical protein